MRLTEILLLLIVGWTLIGAVGVTLTWRRGERRKARRNLGWIIGVWTLYMVVLLSVSLAQPGRTLALGVPQCFGELCYTVTGSEEMPGYLTKNARLIRVHIRMTNRGTGSARESVRAYLLDDHGRRWSEVAGLSGVRLATRVPPGTTVTSEPVFKLPSEVISQGLVLMHGRLQPRLLVIGDSESILHRPTIARLR